ncbi:DUF819 family protein, partial [Staphylococcus haemolyticus]|uniref:DUF819 family protein n=1 Tax=Staphylococcus haemolyticus TaxID=1283 RepID=UPI00374F4EB6
MFLIPSLPTFIGTTVPFILLHHSIPYLPKIPPIITPTYIPPPLNFPPLTTNFKTPTHIISSTLLPHNTLIPFYFIFFILIPSL